MRTRPNGRPRFEIAPFLILALAAGIVPAPASAQPCADIDAWAEECSTEVVTVALERCLSGAAVVSGRVGDTRLEVEIARDRADAFRQIGDLGVSPIAEYPDWSAAPEPVRVAFDAVAACVERDPSLLALPEGRLVPTGRDETPVSAPVPWLLLAAFACALGAFAWRLRGARPTPRGLARAMAPPIALGLVASTVRAAMAEPGFVHQNGQGPLWITHAICVPPVYGPGYFEVFGGAVRALGVEPSAAVFALSSVLGALAAAGTWAIARGAGARPALSLVLGLGVAVEPALARIAQSESYFGVIASLLILAGAFLSIGARRGRVRDPFFVVCVLGAGFLVAQAARIHPVAWVPSATLPLVVLVGRGRLRTRFVATAAAMLGVGAVAAVFALGVIGDVTGGGVGDQWLPDFFARIPRSRLWIALQVAAVAAVVVTFGARDRRRGAVRGAALFAVVAIAFGTHVIGAVGPLIVTAYLLLFLPAFIAALGAGLDGLLRQKRDALIVAMVLAGVLFGGAVWRSEALLELPTDAREQAWLLAHREAVPPDAPILFVGSAGPRRRLHLPFYGECGAEWGPFAMQLSEEWMDRSLPVPSPAVWYRSSLCSTDDGRAICEAMERRLSLTPIATTDLRAIPSMEGLDYDDPTVHVGLYAVGDGR